MIGKDFYKQKMEELFKLMGIASKQMYEMATVLYERIRFNYTDNDLEEALLDIAENEHIKITAPVILKYLNTKRSIRLEKEAKLKKEQEEKESKDFWNRKEQSMKECTNRKCYSCDKKYCDILAIATLSAMKKMLSFNTSSIAERRLYNINVLQELDKQFPGMGFNEEYWLKIINPVIKKRKTTIDDDDFIPEKEI